MVKVARKYETQLIEEGTLTVEESDAMKKNIQDKLEAAYVASRTHHYDAENWVTPEWEKVKQLDQNAAKSSGIDVEKLRDIGLKLSTLPEEHEFHKSIRKIFNARVKSFTSG